MATIKTTGTEALHTHAALFDTYDPGIALPNSPKFADFEIPMGGNGETVHKYDYFFGLDDVSFKSKKMNEVCAERFTGIEIGKADFVRLDAEYQMNEYSSVEFSILDGEEEISILPIQDMETVNERIFFGLPLRFSIDNTKGYVMKKDGVIIDMTPESAMAMSDGVYTITYSPLDAYDYTPKNETLGLKITLRLYDLSKEPPVIGKALIKTYGGEALWINRL